MAGYLSPGAYFYAEEQEYLQAYEDVLERYKDERDKVQKKTFTKWINQHLMKGKAHLFSLWLYISLAPAFCHLSNSCHSCPATNLTGLIACPGLCWIMPRDFQELHKLFTPACGQHGA